MTNSFKAFNNVLTGKRNMPIHSLVQMSFYRMTDYFVFMGKAVVARLVKTILSNTYIAKLAAYGFRTNHHSVRVFHFQHGLVEVKAGQSNVDPNKGGYI